MEAYFDHAATTYVLPEVADLMLRIMREDYGNPSSKHKKGMEAENYIKTAAFELAQIMKVDAKNIVFTSGGTESNNMALIGAAMANRRAGKHIISTPIEHASVYNPLLYLEKQGFELTVIDVDDRGLVNLEALEAAMRDDTILVSVMAVNNEIGAVEPVDRCAGAIHKKNPNTVFHVDGIQAFGKLAIYPKRMGIDLYSVSGHKLHASKGVGALYVNPEIKLHPLLYGGGQQKDMRSGTENVPGIAGLGLAAKLAYDNLAQRIEHLEELKGHLTKGALLLPGVTDNSGQAPHIVSLSFQGVKSEVLLHALEDRGIYVSSGSACSANHPGISGVLKAIGLKSELLDSTLRFSFAENNTKEEIDYTLQVLGELLPMLRKFVRK